MKKSDREGLLQLLQNVDDKILQCDVVTKLTATFEDDVLLKEFTNALCSNEQPRQGIIMHHHHYFVCYQQKTGCFLAIPDRLVQILQC